MSRDPAGGRTVLQRLRFAIAVLIKSGATLVGAWVLGLLVYIAALPRSVEDEASRTDAIVVLTGGSRRVAAGLELLQRGAAGKLLISGVSTETDLPALLQQHGVQDAPCCITLGYGADDTLGNAREAASWVRREGVSSIRLVTSAYHMPRSLLEFRAAMPGTTIVPHPVFTEAVKPDEWWRWPGTAALLISEYNKYLVAGGFVLLGKVLD